MTNETESPGALHTHADVQEQSPAARSSFGGAGLMDGTAV